MAKVNIVNKQVQMDLPDIIKFQLLTHCYINRITLSELDFDCLTQLGILGESELTDFCTLMAPQTIRNLLIKVEKDGLIYKTGKGRKRISLNPELKIQTIGNILLNHKIVYVEPKEA
jgi:hypothetical protein